MKKCDYCTDVWELDGECLGNPWEGTNVECGECNAEYYITYNETVNACNEQAQFNHPKLPKL